MFSYLHKKDNTLFSMCTNIFKVGGANVDTYLFKKPKQVQVIIKCTFS